MSKLKARSNRNEIDGYAVTEDDKVLAALFCEEVRECLQLRLEASEHCDSRIDKCCDLIERWLTVICGETVWFRVSDIDRNILGNFDFAVIVGPNNDKEPLVDEAIKRMGVVCDGFKMAMGVDYEGSIIISVVQRWS